MKLKKILTCLMLCLLSLTGLLFGCGDKYKNFKIEINGESSINLVMNNSDDENEKEVLIKISNAPSKVSKNISYETNKANIVKVENITTNEDLESNIARFKISAIENITSYNPSCVITFKTAEGNKTCQLNVNVEIPITDFKINQEYSPYVVTDGKDYYINTASLIMFEPANTTQRDVTYTLQDPTLIDRYGIELTENGKISVDKYVDDNGLALPSFDVLVKSVQDPTKERTVTINVYKEITAEDVLIAYDFEEQIENPFNSSINKFTGEELLTLSNNGIAFASNIEDKKEADLGIFLKNGLDYNKIKVSFEKNVLNNAIIEENNNNNLSNLLSQYKIYVLNPNVDILVINLSYKDIVDYKYSISVPINVLEYPINLLVNSSDKINYNIFDHYEGNNKGQEFKISVLTAGAFDKKFKVALSEEAFNNLEIRYQNELLDYVTLSNMVFENESSLFIKAKSLISSVNAQITFYSNIVDFNAEIDANLVKTLNLNLTPGIKMLDYMGVFQTNDILYLQTNQVTKENNTLGLEFVINGQAGEMSLSEYVSVEVISGGELIEISKSIDSNNFIFKSKNKTGIVKVKLYSENGLEAEEKTIEIYNYYDETKVNEKLTLDTTSNNLKVVQENANAEIKYYLGLSKGTNNATIKVLNPQNASVYSATVQSSNSEIINASLVSLQDLTFYLHALKETTEPIEIIIILTLFNENELVNVNTFVTQTLVLENVYTYNPIINIEKTQKQVVVIDGDNLDIDSLSKELNVLDVEKYLKIEKADNDLSTLKVEYIMPSALIKSTETVAGDYEFIDKDNSPFNKISFHAGKNREFDVNGEYSFSFTIRIQDLVGSKEYHLVTLKVVLQKHVKPDGIKILNENGYLYLTNKQSFGQINAIVYSDTLKEVTNKSLAYEIKSGNSIDVDQNGFVTIKSSGVTEVLIKAKASQYVEGGTYSATKTIYVVVADGSEIYPYIYNGSFENNKYYTLNEDIVLNSAISAKIGGINGKFVYANYTSLTNTNISYNLIYNDKNPIFGKALEAKLQNLNIVINTSNVNVTNEFGFVANTNNVLIKNVNLILPQTTLTITGEDGYNIGLMFADNSETGIIENCKINGNLVLNADQDLDIVFGGIVGENQGAITGEYNFSQKSQILGYTSTLNIIANAQNAVIGGLVGKNAGTLTNLNVQSLTDTNSTLVGGIVGEFIAGTTATHNLLFKGNISSSNNNSIVGGIAAKITADINFELLVTEFVNINKTTFGANLKGATVGGLFGEAIGSSTKINIDYSFVNSLVEFDEEYFDIAGVNVGGLIAKAENVNLTAVYTNVTISGTNVGAFINEATEVNVVDAYSYSNTKALINSGNAIVNSTYSTKSEFVIYGETVTPEGNYTIVNYTKVLSDTKFKEGRWSLNTNLNNGLPYLVYKKNGIITNLLTVVPTSINANIKTGELIENNYSYGASKNIVVINENNESTRAIIYFEKALSYSVEELLNITTIPANADKSNIRITSSNNNVIGIRDNILNIISIGDVTLTISYLQNLSVNVYISVVEKISEFRVDSEEFNILKNNTKLFNTTLNAAGLTGVYFKFDTDVTDYLYYNNDLIENNEIYSEFDAHIFKGLSNIVTYVDVVPYYVVKFNNVEYKVLDYSLKRTVQFKVIEGAKSISSSVRSLEFVEGDSIDFEVVVKTSNPYEALNLVIENIEDKIIENVVLNSNENSSNDFTINVKKELVSNGNAYILTFAYNKSGEKLKADKLFILKINPETRADLIVSVDLLVKSSKLINVELNHYSSTTHYYNDYDSIITPASTPSSKIVAGNLGVLNINLYPVYASLDKVEVISNVVNGNKITFSQLAFKEEELLNGTIKAENMIVTGNAGIITNGIALNLNRSILDINNEFKFNGNLYVSTLLPTNVAEDTIFTITIICYYNNLADSKEYTIDLTAKPLTSIVLTNPKNNGFYLAKGTELELNIDLINFEGNNTTITPLNFETKVLNRGLLIPHFVEEPTISIKNVGTDETPSYKLIVKTDILTPSGLEYEITPKFDTKTSDGQIVTAYSGSIVIKVVDFVVNSIEVENAESGILDNNLGNVSLLKAKLNVTRCESVNNDILKLNELDRIISDIQTLEEVISKSNSVFNLVTRNTSGNEIYTNIVAGGNYPNFTVSRNNDGYLELKGKTISTSNLLLRANISYENGKVQLNKTSSIEFRNPFVFNVKTYSSGDNPLPIKTYEEFLAMEEGEDYILLNDIDIPSDFTGISTNISSFDGNNKIINLNGFTVNQTNITSLGLFNNISEDTVIKNVTVNILPTLFYIDSAYYYGININAQALTELNFGIIAGTNAGVVTNCKVVNNNLRIINSVNQYKEVVIYVNASETIDLNIAGLVGVNTGYITNSKVGSTTSSNSIKIMANSNLGGLVSKNENKIAASYVVNTTLINNSKTKMTGGFVASNGSEASIITSYVEGYVDREYNTKNNISISDSILDGGVFATNYAGGFVHLNEGKIKDSYSNIKVATNKRSAGFVYDNSTGYVETSFSASTSNLENAQSFRYFTGNDEENVVLNDKGIVNCYYKGTNKDGDDDNEFEEPANGISLVDDASMFEGFITENSSSTIWKFKDDCLPTLYDSNLNIISERELIQNNSNNSDVYNYIYINNNIGSINNPIIVSTSQELLNALTNSSNLYSYYFNGRINQTSINYKHIQIVKDIDLSTIIDINNNKVNSTTEVQKLQDIIFAGNLNGNGMNISNVTITAKNNLASYTSFGLFKQIGVELTYDVQGNIANNNLDEDNCSVIKNINFDINTISATLTRSVGTLAGEVINSKLYNIKINSQNNVTVTGSNMVGAVAGRISGNSYVQGVHTNLSVQATHNKTSDYTYKTSQVKRIYKYAYDVVNDTLNSEANFVGGLFGVVDIYQTVVTNYAQQSDGKSYFITANIIRINNINEYDAQIKFVSTTGDIKIQGDVVGGLFGYVGSGSVVFDARFILQNTSTQNLIADYAVGAIAGENRGYITYATVEHEEELQIEIDKQTNKQTQISASSLFANTNNKALIVGGLVGILKDGVLTNSYSKANIYALNSQYVGAAVGQFDNSKMHHVYSVSEVYAQNEVIQSNGLVTQQKGYAGLIGTVTNFNDSNTINDVVFVIKNSENPSNFNFAGLIGYNNDETVKISGETNAGEISLNNYFGNYPTEEDLILNLTYADYVNKVAGRFADYDNENWEIPLVYDKETFPYLIYNRLGNTNSIDSEDDLRNMLAGGSYTLTSDIFLTKPWEPMTFESGTLNSAKRPTEEERKARGEYYKIYNLNISSTMSNVGFFANTNNVTVENVTFVVGTTYDGKYAQDRYKTLPEEDFVDMGDSWSEYNHDGIYVQNNNLNTNTFRNPLGIAAVSGSDINSYFNNVKVEFNKLSDARIATNLQNVGGIIGKADGTKIVNCSVKNLTIDQQASRLDVEYDTAFRNTQNIGGIVGYGNNINQFTNNSVINANIHIEGGEYNYAYIGFIAGQLLMSDNADSDIENLAVTVEENNAVRAIGGENKITNRGGKEIYAGGIAGNISHYSSITKLTLKNTLLDINTSKMLNSLQVGGLFGNANINKMTDISIDSSNKIDLKTGNSESGKNETFIGGLIGCSLAQYNKEAELKNIICFNNITAQIRSRDNSCIGGIIGRNGNKDNPGLALSNIISKTYLDIKETNDDELVNINLGGIIGKNWENSINNAYYIGKARLIIPAFDNVGGLIGFNVIADDSTNNGTDADKNYIENSYFIEDLNQIAARRSEYGEAISYNEFLTNNETFNNLLLEIFYSENFNFENISNEGIIFDGNEISFEEGGVFNPINITKDDEENLVYSSSTLTLDNSDENNYFLLQNDIQFVEEEKDYIFEEFKGNLLGNGHTITTNKTFAQTISVNSLISSVVFKVKTNETKTINNITYNTKVYNIVAKTNHGTIFNVATIGKLYLELEQNIAPIVDLNEGFISNTISNVDYLIKTEKISRSVSGFARENKATIYNSISSGNIEVVEFNSSENETPEDKYITNAKNTLLDSIAGFVSSNNTFITNVVSSTTLPTKDLGTQDNYNYDIKNSGDGITINTYIDFYANGDYKATSKALISGVYVEEDDNYISTTKLINKIKEGEAFVSNWTNSLETLYGYNYPILSIFSGEKDFLAQNLITVIDDENTSEEEKIYLINNFGVFNYILDTLLEDESVSKIYMQQIRSFNGSVFSSYNTQVGGAVMRYIRDYYQTKDINKSLHYNGNGFVIEGLNANGKEEEGSIYAGLFYNTNDKFTYLNEALEEVKGDVEIAISNLAITNATFETKKQGTEENPGDETLYGNVYLGAIIAYAKANTILDGCYMDGTLSIEKVEIPEGKDSAELVVGGLIGKIETGTVSNCVSNVQILLKKLQYSSEVVNNDDTLIKFKGFNSTVGGILGSANNAKVCNNYAFKDILVSTSVSLNLGGIVGYLENGELKDNLTISKPAYNGAYLSYYKPQTNEELTYNANAVAGHLGSAVVVSGNHFNSLLSFVNDNNFENKEGTTLSELIVTLQSAYQNAENVFMQSGASQMVEMPNIKTDDAEGVLTNNKVLNLEDNTIYIIDLIENSEIEFNTDSIKKEEVKPSGPTTSKIILKNTTIIFVNKVVTCINANDGNSRPIFDELQNCTISNLEIRTNGTLTNATLAEKVVNTQLFKINLNDAYINHTGSNMSDAFGMGMIVNVAESSYLSNININKGRLEVARDNTKYDRIGAIVGYAENTLIQESTNEATITVYNKNQETSVGGILGYGSSSSIFKGSNKGLIYVKGNSQWKLNVAGIANMTDNSTISFSTNYAKIKGVNDYESDRGERLNIVSGIGNDAAVLYSINTAEIMSISRNAKISVSNGIAGGSSVVYYSYNAGTIISNNTIYTITSATGYGTFNIGNGYSQDSVQAEITSTGSYNFNLTKLSTAQLQNGEFKDLFASSGDDFVADTKGENNHFIKGSNDIYAYNAAPNEKQQLQWLVCILAIETEFKLETEKDPLTGDPIVASNNKETYLISSPFELWYWATYLSKTEYNVKLTTDIDMRGFNWPTDVNLAQSVIFDGQHRTIKNLTLSSENDIRHQVGFINTNNGTIKNINFENPKVELYLSDKHFTGGTYNLSVVCQTNNGTIDNILISSTNGEGLIKVNCTASFLSEGSEATFNIGLAAANNYGTVKNVEVICLDNFAINSCIELTSATMALKADRIDVHLGGIVGWTNSGTTIDNCIMIGPIASTLRNMTMFGDIASLVISNEKLEKVANDNGIGLDDLKKIINENLIALYGYAHQYVGKIVGYGKVDISDCYAPTTIDDKDQFLSGKNENSLSIGIFGEQTMSNIAYDSIRSILIKSDIHLAIGTVKHGATGLSKLLKSKAATKTGDFLAGAKDMTKVSNLAKSGKAGIKGIVGSIKASNIIGWIITAYQLGVQTPWNEFSYKLRVDSLRINKWDEGDRPYHEVYDINNTNNFNKYDFDDPYIKLFSANFAAYTEVYNAFATYFKGNGDKTSGEKTFPLNTNFLNLSVLKEEPQFNNKTYYVYNAQELAYALTQNNNFAIEFMDHIDMSNRIWDDALTITSDNNFNIISNNFKVLLGPNTGKGLEEVLGVGNYISSSEINDINEYGYADDVSENKVEIAYEKFNKRFIEKYNGSPSQAIRTETNELEQTVDNYYINSEEQIEVIADALNTYSYGESGLHIGIDMSGINFIIENDLDLTNRNLNSFDSYQYQYAYVNGNSYSGMSSAEFNALSEDNNTIKFVFQITREVGNTHVTTEETLTLAELTQELENDKTIVGYLIKYLTPDFVDEDNQKAVITFTTNVAEIKSFNGNISGKYDVISGKYPTITLPKGNTFISKVYSNSIISDLIIKPSSNKVNLTDNKDDATFGFIANVNDGTIKNIKLDCSNIKGSLDYSYEFYFENLEYQEEINKDNKKAKIANLNYNIGLITGGNTGKILDCKITNITDASGNLQINNSVTSLTELNKEETPEMLSIMYNFALYTGFNSGYIDGVNLDSVSNVIINKIGDLNTELTDSVNSETYSVSLISAYNYFKPENIGFAGIKNVIITNSNISLRNFDNDFDYIGLISGYNTLNISDCTIINSSVKHGDANYLVGMLKPSIYVLENYTSDDDEEGQAIHTIFKPSFNNIISNIEFANVIVKYAISDVKTIKNEDGEEKNVSAIFVNYDNGEGWTTAISDNEQAAQYFFETTPGSDSLSLTELKGADNYKIDSSNCDEQIERPGENNSIIYYCKYIEVDTAQKKFEFNVSDTTRILKDAEGNTVKLSADDNFSRGVLNENHTIRLKFTEESGKSNIIIPDNTAYLYLSNDIENLSQANIKAYYVINGVEYEGNKSDIGLLDQYVTLSGAKIPLDVNISYVAAQGNSSCTLTVTYNCQFSDIEVESGTTYEDILESFASSHGLTFKLPEGSLKSDEVTAGIHTIQWNYDSQTDTYLSNAEIKIVVK